MWPHFTWTCQTGSHGKSAIWCLFQVCTDEEWTGPHLLLLHLQIQALLYMLVAKELWTHCWEKKLWLKAHYNTLHFRQLHLNGVVVFMSRGLGWNCTYCKIRIGLNSCINNIINLNYCHVLFSLMKDFWKGIEDCLFLPMGDKINGTFKLFI